MYGNRDNYVVGTMTLLNQEPSTNHQGWEDPQPSSHLDLNQFESKQSDKYQILLQNVFIFLALQNQLNQRQKQTATMIFCLLHVSPRQSTVQLLG